MTSAWGNFLQPMDISFSSDFKPMLLSRVTSLASAGHPGTHPNRNNVPLFSKLSFGSPQGRPELGVRVGRAMRKEEEEGWMWIFKGQLEYGS